MQIGKIEGCLALCYDLTIDLRGMNFLFFPYHAVLNGCVLDDAVVADGYVGADGTVLDDHVLAYVARGNQLHVDHGEYSGANYPMKPE